MGEEKKSLVETATKLFSEYSILTISVEDFIKIAEISPRIFLQVFASKSGLLQAVIDAYLLNNEQYLAQLNAQKLSAASEIICFFEWLTKRTEPFSKYFFSDLSKYYPDIYQRLRHALDHQLESFLKNNIVTGRVQGVYSSPLKEDYASETSPLTWSLHLAARTSKQTGWKMPVSFV